MELAGITAYKIVQMFIVMVVGGLGYKKGIITKEGNKRLSEILLLIVSPALIFTSYQQEFDPHQLTGLMQSMLLAFLTHVLGIMIAKICIKTKEGRETVIERFSTIFSNCGFIGIPLVGGIYGAEGVLYTTAYITMFNLFLWTYGVMIMTGKADLKGCMKALMSPNIIAIVLGLVTYLLRIKLPPIILEPVSMIAAMNTPTAMFVAGASIASEGLGEMFRNKRYYYLAFTRLLLVPCACIVLLKCIPFDEIVENSMLIAAACPVGTTSVSFALRYGKNEVYASHIFGLTTLLCIITIPVIIMLSSVM